LVLTDKWTLYLISGFSIEHSGSSVGIHSGPITSEDVLYKSTQHLLRKLILLVENLSPLPDTVFLNARFNYQQVESVGIFHPVINLAVSRKWERILFQ
jgi:hypothetical protein